MQLSIIIALLNEVESLKPLHEKLTTVLNRIGKQYEIIYIDDGSDDGSFDVLKEIHAEDKTVKVIRFRRNFGKSAALAAGFAQAQGEIMITLDADMQDDPAEIPRFLSKIDEGYDLVVGWKYPRLDPITKTLPSKLYNFVLRTSTGIMMHEFNSGFKAIRGLAAKELRLYGEMHRYIPVLVHWRGYGVTEIKVKHHPRQFGKSKFGLSRFSRGLFDFITVYFLTQFNRRPLHFFGWLGTISFALGFIINLYLSIIWFSGELIGSRPLLILGTLLLIIGGQFFSLGLIAEMVTYDTYSRETDYSIRETLE